MTQRKIVWAADTHMHPKEFFDKLDEYKDLIHSVKINSYFYFLASKFPLTLRATDLHGCDYMFDLKLYDTPKTTAATVEALPNCVKYITLVWAEDNDASVEAGLRAAQDRGVVCFLVNRLTSAPPGTIDQTAKFYNVVADMANKFDNVGVVLPADRLVDLEFLKNKAPSVVTLTPGVKIDNFLSQDYSDQKVVTTPQDVVRAGGDLIVLGRSMPDTREDLIQLERSLSNE